MEIRTPGRTTEAGFTIVEVMVAMVLLLTGVLGLVQMADTANTLTVNNRTRVEATGLARQVIETARDISYTSLTSSSLVTTLQSQAGLADADVSTTGWQILNSRRNRDFTITASVCTLDNSKDGARAASATAPSGSFCTQSVGAGSTPTNEDGNPDDYRRINVTVAWQRPTGVVASCGGDAGGNGTSCVTQSTLIQNPSGGLGPNIKTVEHHVVPDDGLGDPIEDPAKTSAFVDITTQSAADTLNWNMDDGRSSGQATALTGDTTGTRWNFTWDYGDGTQTVDGTYNATLQAFLSNSGGNAFPHLIRLNRYVPTAPNVVVPGPLTGDPPSAGGVNTRLATLTPPLAPPVVPVTGSGHVVELRWNKNPERDIVGYMVFKVSGTVPSLAGTLGATKVCRTAASVTSCFDPNPPDSGAMNYYVVALDQRRLHPVGSDPLTYTCPGYAPITVDYSNPTLFPGTDRPGCPSAMITINITSGLADARPAFSANLSVTTNTSTGLPKLSWDNTAAATQADGDHILFYRIYRDPLTVSANGPDYASRIGTTADGTKTTFEDNTPGVSASSTHTYYVVAVDQHYNESDPINPITWVAP